MFIRCIGNDVIFQSLWRHSCQFKPQFFYSFLTCTCIPPLWKRFRHPCLWSPVRLSVHNILNAFHVFPKKLCPPSKFFAHTVTYISYLNFNCRTPIIVPKVLTKADYNVEHHVFPDLKLLFINVWGVCLDCRLWLHFTKYKWKCCIYKTFELIIMQGQKGLKAFFCLIESLPYFN